MERDQGITGHTLIIPSAPTKEVLCLHWGWGHSGRVSFGEGQIFGQEERIWPI